MQVSFILYAQGGNQGLRITPCSTSSRPSTSHRYITTLTSGVGKCLGREHVGSRERCWFFHVRAPSSHSLFSCLTCLNSGNINLPRILPFLGKTQLQVLSVVVSLLLLVGHLVMAMLVKESVLCRKSQGKSFHQEIRDLWRTLRTLPHVIRQIVCILSPPLNFM